MGTRMVVINSRTEQVVFEGSEAECLAAAENMREAPAPLSHGHVIVAIAGAAPYKVLDGYAWSIAPGVWASQRVDRGRRVKFLAFATQDLATGGVASAAVSEDDVGSAVAELRACKTTKATLAWFATRRRQARA